MRILYNFRIHVYEPERFAMIWSGGEQHDQYEEFIKIIFAFSVLFSHLNEEFKYQYLYQ